MPEARDRLSRQDDVLDTYSTRRRISSNGVRNDGGGNSVIFVLEDEADEGPTTRTPFRWRGTAMVNTPRPMGEANGRGNIGTPRIGRGVNFRRSPAPFIGGENLSPVVGSGRGRAGSRGRGSSVLPYWFPRRPLRDITAVVRAIERRGRLEEDEGLQSESPIPQDRIVHDPSASTSDAQLEHDFSNISPDPMIGSTHCPPTIGKVPKILLDITNQKDGDSVCLTPQKKLLNNIDTIEKVVMEELRKLKRTPSAKKAENEKRVRTLMSMR